MNARVLRRALTYARDFDALSSTTPRTPTSPATG